MEEKVIMKVDVLAHLDNVKNMNIKSFLNLLDTLITDPKDKVKIRELYLDGFNGYHREVKRTFQAMLGS